MSFLLLGLSSGEMIIVLVVGLLLFGSRLPEVGRSLGRSLMEFKKGMREAETGVFEEPRPTSASFDDAPRHLTEAPAPVDGQRRP